jgi:Protein of unknown function (DUF2846)
MKILMAMIIVAALSSCASVPMDNPDADQDAKNFSVSPDHGRIYIYRNETFGAAVKITVSVDGKLIGQTAKKTYYAIDVAPGKHQVSCFAESNASVDVNVDKGSSVFVWQEMKMGLMAAGCDMHTVDANTGREAVLECKRARAASSK